MIEEEPFGYRVNESEFRYQRVVCFKERVEINVHACVRVISVAMYMHANPLLVCMWCV